jgi:predicted amidohydrolase YtcJ
MSREEFKDLLLRAAASGIAVAVHAIGDAANRIAIEVFEETVDVWRPAGLRPRIEHVQLLAPGDAERLGRLGVIASMQPIHATSDWRVADRHWGARSFLAYAWRTVLASGAPLAFGSDCPVETLDPLAGIHAAVTRERRDGRPAGGWQPQERITAYEALRAYTWGAAYAAGEELQKGSLAVGKVGDLVVLSEDVLHAGPESLRDTQVLYTISGGQIVYQAPGA